MKTHSQDSDRSKAPSIDSVAALFVSLRPTDTTELGSVRDKLLLLAFGNSASPGVAEQLRAAAGRIDELLSGKAKDPAAVLEAAGEAIEMAQLAAQGKPVPKTVSSEDTEGLCSVARGEGERAETLCLPEEADVSLLPECIEECLGQISAAEAALNGMEGGQERAEHVNTLFRAFHSIKSVAGLMGTAPIENLAHLAERLFMRIRSGELELRRQHADIALRACAALKSMVESLRGIEPGGQCAAPMELPSLNSELLALKSERGTAAHAGKETGTAIAQGTASPAASRGNSGPPPPHKAPVESRKGIVPAVETRPLSAVEAKNRAIESADGAGTPSSHAEASLRGECGDEIFEHLAAGEVALRRTQANPEDKQQLDALFRAFNSIKGLAGLVGVAPIERLAHLTETALNPFRTGEEKAGKALLALAARSHSLLKEMLMSFEGSDRGGTLSLPPGFSALCSEIEERIAGGSGRYGQRGGSASSRPPAEKQTSPEPDSGSPQEKRESVSRTPRAGEPRAQSLANPAQPTTEESGEKNGSGRKEFRLPADTDVSLLKECAEECSEHIAAGEAALLDLEAQPGDPELINTLFRSFHSIKSLSGLAGLAPIQKLAHLAENMFARVRNGEIEVTGRNADLALRACDTIKAMLRALDDLEAGGGLPLPADLDALYGGLSGEEVPLPTVSALPAETEPEAAVPAVEVPEDQPETPAAKQAPPAKPQAPIAELPALEEAPQKAGTRSGAEAKVRVDTARLDNLLDMVGELVISYSMLAQSPEVSAVAGRGGGAAHGHLRLASDISESPLVKSVVQIGKIVRELQDVSMSLRMVSLQTTFQKMTRLVRELSRKSDKPVQFITEGEETEIDRNMVEVINDPLVHMIRNAVDHGIEPKEERLQAGKPEAGVVRLRAFHSAGNVVIEISDDGRGLQREKIVRKAIERGIVEPNSELSDSEVFGLIFQPGFSTADKVTDISGRGVGMDVVRKNIDSLRGRIDIASEPGRGTVFKLRMPLTMAIADAMLIKVGAERYFVPTISIEQSFRPARDSVSTIAGRGEMVKLRGSLMPLLRLHHLFKIEGAKEDPYEAILVVLEGEGKRCALMVDALLGQQQVVIKSLGETFAQSPGVAGAAILGDGHVGLILDPVGILDLARQVESWRVGANVA